MLAEKNEISWKLRQVLGFPFILTAANQSKVITDVYLGTYKKGNTQNSKHLHTSEYFNVLNISSK